MGWHWLLSMLPRGPTTTRRLICEGRGREGGVVGWHAVALPPACKPATTGWRGV